MNRLWAFVGMGFLGLVLAGCGGSGDVMPDVAPVLTPEQEAAAKAETEEGL
jgi:hypothetical protein